jgi:hypothetical protein
VGKIDFDNIFYSGHSRGGSTTEMNTIFHPHWVRGMIPIMQVDPRGWSCFPDIPTSFPPVPCLSFSAEKDGDVIWPIAEVSMDDKTRDGMTTHVTVYGACHNQTGDTHSIEFGTSPTINHAQQQERIRHWFTTFLERHTRGDLRLEGQLYLDEQQSNNWWAVFGQRDMNGAVQVDDHQATGTATNLIGGPNTSTVISITETNTMPGGYTYGRSLLHRRFGFASGAGTNTWSAPAGNPVDTSGLSWLSFRVRQYNTTASGPSGVGSGDYRSWLPSWTITMEDGAGTTATVDMHPEFPASGGPSPGQQRFTRFSFPFSDFVVANPLFDPSSLQYVRFTTGPSGTSSRYVSIDDVRWE